MRVLFATGIYPPEVGGPSTYVSHLAHELHVRGVGVDVITYGDSSDEDLGFRVVRVPKRRTVASRYRSFYAAASNAARAADVIYAQDLLSVGLPSALAGRRCGRPVVVKVVGDQAWEIAVESKRTADSFQAFQVRRQPPVVEMFRYCQRLVARNALHVIVPSRFLEEVVLGWGVAPERVSVVHNSLPERPQERKRGEARRELGIEGSPLILAAGRLVPWKRFELPIRSLPIVLRRNPSARLLIVGSGPHEPTLKALVRELALENAVTFQGSLHKDAMRLHLVASDFLVLPSSYEGFSHVLLEAMRLGTPVLATDAGGNAELVGDAGRLVPAESSEHFAHAMAELSEGAELRVGLAALGLERVRKFNWSELVDKTLQILESARSCSVRSTGSSSRE